MIYLASPYSHPDPLVRERRYLSAVEALHWYVVKGFACFSPIVHSHDMAKIYDMGRDWETWATYNKSMFRRASELHILTLEGWEKSKGIRKERAWAEELLIPENFITTPREVISG